MFTSWGVETARKFTKAEVEHALTELDTGNYGMIPVSYTHLDVYKRQE